MTTPYWTLPVVVFTEEGDLFPLMRRMWLQHAARVASLLSDEVLVIDSI